MTRVERFTHFKRLKERPHVGKGTVQEKIIFVTLLLLLNGTVNAAPSPLIFQNAPLKQGLKEKLKKNIVLSDSKVKSSVKAGKKIQNLKFYIAGLHQRRCRVALSKLSRYEDYHQFVGFISRSSYDEVKKRINLDLSSKLLPFDMRLNFQIPRIKSPGAYPFSFDLGFLKGLTGVIHVSEYKGRCFFYTTADWSGPDSGIPDIVFEFFSQTLAKISMEKLFRLSKTY